MSTTPSLSEGRSKMDEVEIINRAREAHRVSTQWGPLNAEMATKLYMGEFDNSDAVRAAAQALRDAATPYVDLMRVAGDEQEAQELEQRYGPHTPLARTILAAIKRGRELERTHPEASQ